MDYQFSMLPVNLLGIRLRQSRSDAGNYKEFFRIYRPGPEYYQQIRKHISFRMGQKRNIFFYSDYRGSQ